MGVYLRLYCGSKSHHDVFEIFTVLCNHMFVKLDANSEGGYIGIHNYSPLATVPKKKKKSEFHTINILPKEILKLSPFAFY